MLAIVALSALIGAQPSAAEIYGAARLPFGIHDGSVSLVQVLVEQGDGTFAGTIEPVPDAPREEIWERVRVQTIVGEWDAVSRRIGNVYDERGALAPIERALGVPGDDRPDFLIMSTVESPDDGFPKKACVVMLTGVSAGHSSAGGEAPLIARPIGALVGCGALKDVLQVAKPDFTKTADPERAWRLGQQRLLDDVAHVLKLNAMLRAIILKQGGPRHMRFLAALLLLAPASAETTTRHATPDGTGSECSTARPCSLDQAIRKASCGDTVSAADGTYGGIKISKRNCTTVKRLTVTSATPLGAVIDISRGEGIALHDANYVTVSGFRINQHAGAQFGIQINGGIGVTMKDITIVGDTTTCTTVPLIGDHVYAFDTTGLTLDGLNVGKPENGECNYVEDTACFSLPRNTGTTLKNSTCHDIRNFGTFANSSDVTVDGNIILNLHNHGIGMVDVTNAVVQRNIFTATSTATNIGDALWLVCSHGINFRNNLIHGTSLFPVGAYTSHPNCDNSANKDRNGNDWPSNDGILHSNNIYLDSQKPGCGWALSLWNQYWARGTPFKSNHNMYNGNNFVARFEPTDYQTLEAWTAARVLGYAQDAKSLTARPQFVNDAARDYRPSSSTAPQVDAGDDANCANTIAGAHCDIGPFELPPAAPGQR